MDIAAERAYPTPAANSPLLPLLLLSLASQRNTPITTPIEDISDEYDFIIVGAGSAGSVVASRLSENNCYKILLLEAGKSAPLVNDVPAYGRSFWFTDIDWTFKSVPQRYTGRGLVDRKITWPSGKGLGGSSLLNAMLYVRGNKKNYNDWAALGATGWSYEDVLPYFKKMEDNQNPKYVMDGYHGTDGPLTVEDPAYHSLIKDPLSEAIENLGYEVVDSNAFNQTGFYDQQGTMRNQQRCSTAKAYLVPAENRTNLDIVDKAFVTKILINKGRAEGVTFDHENQTYRVRARKEVILSAGTTNTAQLLMLSGIGPRTTLQKFKIPVVKDLPVGQNMQDHCSAQVSFELSQDIPRIADEIEDSENIQEYIDNRTGVLTTTEAVSYVAFLRGATIRPKIDNPNYELYLFETADAIPKYQYGLTQQVYNQVFGPYQNSSYYTCFAQNVQPRSKGYVTISSKNPYDPPVINPNYFSNQRDIQDMVDGLKTCIKIGTSDPMRKIGSRLFTTRTPGCEQYPAYSDLDLECIVRSFVVTMSHQVGTATMGNPKNRGTVVDPQLRVKGVKGLRVVDASVMPIVPSGNTNIPTIMVAEKASDIIKSQVKCS